MFGRTASTLLLCCFSFLTVPAQTTPAPSPTPETSVASSDEPKKDPIQNADSKKSKLTFGVYFQQGSALYDLNLRHKFGPWKKYGSLTAWIAGFYDRAGGNQLIRVGAQYDFQKAWFHLTPSIEIATTKAVSGSITSQLGSGKTVAIVGISRTNLKAFFDLYWDPSEAVTLGVQHALSSYDSIQAFTVFDVRLHTEQQNTHVLYRHKLNRNNGITFDAVFKTGHGDSGEFIRTAGIGVYYDRPRWFWKLYLDPHVNFTPDTMVRTGIGWKF